MYVAVAVAVVYS